MKMPYLVPLACAVAAGAVSAAESCEALRAQIEAKIAAAGVARFAVVTVDAAAPAGGQVVGSCELGSKKIVYQREGGPGPSAALPPPVRGERILTECKDGTVSLGGDCRK
ncbi:DUF1161 domain-containing protein [Variovorax sp. JS1663]|uniref:DUF1161 domain-containing protein n=1 Tax=Variovorax sp. JS1663 TaxID=1851577 RepID=UPI000B34982E|nr:DUF1161 domain-containing protein [Variovorax sp. JS1663]OUL98605.1 hypothetical protein A8M77_30725 [Variovorax sp. JS1663]